MIKPKNWRTGQTIFNFLEYLREKGYPTNQNSRLADPFHIMDETWDKEYAEFISSRTKLEDNKMCENLQVDENKVDTYFLSFINEEMLNPKYNEYVSGRVEVYSSDSGHPIEEIRFFTKDTSFYEFRNKWDFKDITKKQLNKLRKIISSKFYERNK